MYRQSRDESLQAALRASIFSNGHRIVSIENVTTNKRRNIQHYEILYKGVVERGTIYAEFNCDFEAFYLPRARSYVKINSIRYVEDEVDIANNTMCCIIVKYCGEYRPFPTEMSRKQLEDQNAELHLAFDNLYKSYRYLYVKYNKEEECPVCYTILESVNLELPSCAHAICKKCYSACDKCPLCRKSYS
jgi:hypothetical protein